MSGVAVKECVDIRIDCRQKYRGWVVKRQGMWEPLEAGGVQTLKDGCQIFCGLCLARRDENKECSASRELGKKKKRSVVSWVKNGQLVRRSSATGVPAGGEGGKRASSWYIIDQRPISESEKY